MIVDNIQHERQRAKVRRNHLRNILDWGENNDYPQSVEDIVNGSIMGTTCLDIYNKFIYGFGFADKNNYQIIVNNDGETADALLRKVVEDFAKFGGFALHVNRNLLGQITSFVHIPMENVRLCIDDKEEYDGKVALHTDWGGRSHKRFAEEKIEYLYLYDPNIEVFRERVAEAGGILNYKGEIYLYSNRGKNYPLPTFDAALTAMATEEAVDNITYCNAKRGFLPAGCFAEVDEYFDANNEQDKARFEAFGDALKGMQGDKNASSIMHVIVKDKESLPQFISMRADNYDKDYEVTRTATDLRIGKAFRQPKELRCEDSANGFATDKMVQAYNVYNSITSYERQILEEQFAYLFKNWHMQMEYNFNIAPLVYGKETLIARIGENAAKEAVSLASNAQIPIEQRKALLQVIFGLTEEETNIIYDYDSNH